MSSFGFATTALIEQSLRNHSIKSLSLQNVLHIYHMVEPIVPSNPYHFKMFSYLPYVVHKTMVQPKKLIFLRILPKPNTAHMTTRVTIIPRFHRFKNDKCRIRGGKGPGKPEEEIPLRTSCQTLPWCLRSPELLIAIHDS